MTVTAEPGAELKLGGLTVNGTLKAEGSAEKPVLFTSQTNTGAGQWEGIAFASGSGSSVLNHAEVRYTGSGPEGAIRIEASSPTIENSTIRNNTYRGIYVSFGGSPDIANNSIISNGQSGVFYKAAGGSGEVKIHGNLIEGSANFGIYVETAKGTVKGTTLSENTIKSNSGGAIAYEGGDLPPDLGSNTLSGNGNSNKVFVYGTVSQVASWSDPGAPIQVEKGSLTVAKSGSLTLGAGLTLKFEKESLTVNGTLKAEGTSGKPVLFTSQTNTGAGQWGGIAFASGSGSSVLNHAEVRYTGSGPEGAIRIEASSPTIENSTIRNNTYRGIYVFGGGSPDIANNSLISNGQSGIFYQSIGGSGEVKIHGNLIEGSANFGVYVEAIKGSVKGTTLSGNTIKSNSGGAITYEGGELPKSFVENALSGNGEGNKIKVLGTVSQASTWTDPGAPIRVEKGSLTVAKSGSLTLGAGLTLKFEKESLDVSGTLKAEGTSEKPVLFTSLTNTGPGQWGGINFSSGSGSSVLDHAEVRYTGAGAGSDGAIRIDASSPTIKNSTIRSNTARGIYASFGGSPDIANNSIISNGQSGVFYKAAGGSGEVKIHGNLIESNENFGVYVETVEGSVKGTTLSGNTIKSNSGGAIYYEGGDLPKDFIENTLSSNGEGNRVTIFGTVSQSSTWADPGYPIRVEKGGLEIASGASLALGAGLTLKFEKEPLDVSGTLKAEGTSEKPVLFTSLTNTGAGQWGGITFAAGSGSSVLDHAEVRYTGLGASSEGAITTVGSSPTIKDSTIRNNTSRGIHITGGGSPEIANNSIISNGKSGIFYEPAAEKSGEVKIHGNQLENNENFGIYVETYNNSVQGTTLSGNTVKNNGGGGIAYEGGDLPPDLDENTLSGNGNGNKFLVYGTVSQSASWSDHGFPIKVEEKPLAIAGEATLTLGSGVALKVKEQDLIVNGTLKAQGTAKEPVLITGINDEAPGEWGAIRFEPGSGGSVLDHTEVAFGGSAGGGMIEAKGSHPTITNSTLRRSQNYGIKVTESGSPTIAWNRFRRNASGVSYSGTGKLLAANNDWGCASGPKPAGCGDSAASNVNWEPAVQLPELDGQCRGRESQCGEGADPVSLATGQLDYSHRDLLLTNASSSPLEFTRAYNSGSSLDTGLGPGWSQAGLASATELESGEVLVLRQDGRQDLYQNTKTGYIPPSGVTATLAKVEGDFHLATLQGTVYRFDASGRIASVVDDHGLETIYGYDPEGLLATITDPSAQALAFSYDASNHITKVTDSTGREVKYTYSGAGDLATVTDALGGVTEYTYDAEHRLKTIKDPRGNVILKNTYDGQGRIVEQRDGLENLWKLEYKEGETIVTEPEGGKLKYGFDGQSRVISEVDQLGHTTTTSYDEAGNVDEVVKPGGAKWRFGHDAAGNLTSVIDPEGGERGYEYDGLNRLTSLTDEREETWTYEWDKANDLKKITDPAKGKTTFSYNAAGQPLTVTDPNEHTTIFTYDSRGNRLTVEDPLEHTTTFVYNSRNYLTSKTRLGLEPEEFGRNALGDLLSTTTPEGNKTEYAYDANGIPTQITDPGEGVWKIAYNAMERPTIYTDPLEQQTKISYNGNMKPTKVINRRGKETAYGYDLANQLTEVHAPEGGDWTFGYDSRGNRLSMADPREEETTYEYDLLDRMTEAVEPLETTSEYGYDAEGNLTSVTDPRGNTTGYVYDKLGRLVEVAQPLGKTTSLEYDPVGNLLSKGNAAGELEYAYDAANRLTAVEVGESTLRSYGYDAVNRLTSAIDAESHSIEIGYDGDGRRISIEDGRGQALTRSYNSRGLLTKQVDGRGTLEYGYDKLRQPTSLTDPQGKTTSFAYDPGGDPKEVKRPNGVVTTNVYDDAGRLAEITSKDELGTTLEALEYDYDPAGNIVSRYDARLEEETTYAYDPLERLTEFNSPGKGATSYGYDPAGNRTEANGATYEYNALNQLTESSDGTTYGYDGAGRLTDETNGAGETTYTWDLFDHLASVESEAGSTGYAYDALGRLSQKTTGPESKVMHYGDLSDLATYDANSKGEIVMSYVQGARGLIEERTGSTAYPLADAHGDIVAMTGSGGAVESRQSFDPWGVQLTGPEREMGYLGFQERRGGPASGLIQMGERSYAPGLGAFLSEDPVLVRPGSGLSADRYLYVRDNPLNRYDLNGRDVCVPTPFGDACAEDAAEDVGDFGEDVGNGIGSGARNLWNLTAPPRHWLGDRTRDFVKQIDFSTGEFITNTASILIGYGICAAAGAGATAVGTPVAGAAAVGVCVTSDAITAGGAATDIFDKDNGLWTDSLY